MSLGHKIGIYQYDSASSETDKFEKMGDVIGLSGIKVSADTIEDKPYSEDADDWDEFISTMKRMEEFTLTIRRDKTVTENSTQSDRLFDLASIGQKFQYRLILPDQAKTITFSAIFTSLEIKTETRTRIEYGYSFKPSGAPVLEAVA